MVSIKVAFLVSLFFGHAYAVHTGNLVALVQVFRHGLRTPITFYSNDPYKNHWGDLAPGQLLNEGRRQLHKLGQFTRNRYSNWIPTKYNKNFFYAQTTDVDRTHMSGQSFLFGLFPATGDQVWLSNETWQAIPLHPADPRVLWVADGNCPTYVALKQDVLNSEYFVKVNEENADLYAYLSENTGDSITDIHSAEVIFDSLKIESDVGLTLPEWTKNAYPQPLVDIAGIDFQTKTYTTELNRLYTGPFFDQMVTYFENMSQMSSSSPKFQVYSAHDDNIAAILNSFGAYTDPYPPEFASTIWIELRNTTKNYYVNVWSKDGDNITQISINGCDLDCPLDQVRQRLKHLIMDVNTWSKECGTKDFLETLVNNQIVL